MEIPRKAAIGSLLVLLSSFATGCIEQTRTIDLERELRRVCQSGNVLVLGDRRFANYATDIRPGDVMHFGKTYINYQQGLLFIFYGDGTGAIVNKEWGMYIESNVGDETAVIAFSTNQLSNGQLRSKSRMDCTKPSERPPVIDDLQAKKTGHTTKPFINAPIHHNIYRQG